MSSSSRKFLQYILKPLSWIYGGVTDVRNWMFNRGILKQVEYEVPVVSVGNLTVGGTGKTPHVEYIVGLLSMDYNIAVLSRGYKRKTKGFLLANSNSTPSSIGDEPLQIYNKFGHRVKVAVCENRRTGIRELLRQYPQIQLIIMDDAFQHRYVKPKVSILLTDYHRPIYEDHLLPLGRLREKSHNVSRADMVIVTKCPDGLAPLTYRLISKKLDLMPYQKLYFSNFSYGGLLPVFPDDNPYHVSLGSLTAKDTVLLVTGIANPRGFVRYFKNYEMKVVVSHYPDHHDFSRDDMKHLLEKFNGLTGERKLIITTEKDAVRLSHNPYYPDQLKAMTFYLPIGVKMIPGLEGGDFIADLRKAIDAAPLP